MVGLSFGKAVALGAQPAAGGGSTTWKAMRSKPRGLRRGGCRLSLSPAAGQRRALPAAHRRGRRRLPPAGLDHRRRGRRGLRQDRQDPGPALSQAGRRWKRWRSAVTPEAVPLPAPAGRLGRAAFLLRRPQERGPARRSRPASTGREDIAASFQQAVVDCLVDRTAARARTDSDAPALVVAGGVAANQAIRTALADLAEREGRTLQRAARLAVHRQCRDDRLGRRRALRDWPRRSLRHCRCRAIRAGR